MFFPFLRGRQNELLALRELLETGKLQNVIPIVEPVKASPTLISTLSQFKDAGKELILVENPIVGSFSREISQKSEYAARLVEVLTGFDQLVGMRYCGKGASIEIVSKNAANKAFLLSAGNRRSYEQECEDASPKYTIAPAGNQKLQKKAEGEVIALVSSYLPKNRNADYSESEDDFLSEELFDGDPGCIGFSDYSIIGEEYTEGGFLPNVVALHLVYADSKEEQLGVRHFLSPDEKSGLDVGMKFHIALGKLVSWAKDNEGRLRQTDALREMETIYREERFPGLGYAKKLSLKHHIEMVNEMIGEEE